MIFTKLKTLGSANCSEGRVQRRALQYLDHRQKQSKGIFLMSYTDKEETQCTLQIPLLSSSSHAELLRGVEILSRAILSRALFLSQNELMMDSLHRDCHHRGQLRGAILGTASKLQ